MPGLLTDDGVGDQGAQGTSGSDRATRGEEDTSSDGSSDGDHLQVPGLEVTLDGAKLLFIAELVNVVRVAVWVKVALELLLISREAIMMVLNNS